MITQGLLGIEKTVGSGPRSEMPAARGASRLVEENISSLSFASLIDRLLSSGNGAGGGHDFEAAGARGPEGTGRSEKEKGGRPRAGPRRMPGSEPCPFSAARTRRQHPGLPRSMMEPIQGGEQRASEVKRGGREGKLWVPAAERRRGGTGVSGAFEGAGKNANEISNGDGRHADRRIERGAKLFSHMAGIRTPGRSSRSGALIRALPRESGPRGSSIPSSPSLRSGQKS